MLFSPRIRLRKLAGLCRRLAIALGAGIDLRTAWARETDRVLGRAPRRRFQQIAQAIQQGESLSDALVATGEFFPPLLREMVEVGEQTGHLSEVFAQLAEHYEGQLELRRTFLAAIAWPTAQLGLAVVIVGFLIWIMGVIEQVTQNRVDPLGLGLVGNTGLAIYLAFVAAVACTVFLLVRAARRGLVWTRPLQRAVMRVPALGTALQTLALARLAWSLHLTLNTEMDVRRALRLSLRSTQNAYFTDHIERIDAQIAAGNSIYEAFRRAGPFAPEFLDCLAVAEQSGRLVESMALLARQYREQARLALATLNKLAGLAVWVVVALIIIALIFRLFSFYVAAIQRAIPLFSLL